MLPLPILPDNLIAEFIKACGIPVQANASVLPQDTIGAVLDVMFGTAGTEELQIMSFVPFRKE